MSTRLDRWLERWRRRHWRPGPGSGRYAGMRPLAVVTGASEGIGLAFARELARNGHDLLLVARSEKRLAKVAAELSAGGVVAFTCPADLATEAGCAAVEAALSAHEAYADILVNNAGIGIGGDFAAQPPERLRQLIDLNMRATTDLMRRFLPGMLERGQGGILNVASLGGMLPGPQQAAYYASKAYVISLTEAVAEETKGQGVRVCAVVPGPVATKFHARMDAEHSYFLRLIGVMRPETVARSGLNGFRWGLTLIYPGVLHHIYAVALRLLPHRFILPVVAWMLRPRRMG